MLTNVSSNIMLSSEKELLLTPPSLLLKTKNEDENESANPVWKPRKLVDFTLCDQIAFVLMFRILYETSTSHKVGAFCQIITGTPLPSPALSLL